MSEQERPMRLADALERLDEFNALITKEAPVSDHLDRVFLGDPASDDDRNSVLAIVTNTTEDDAVWLEMWSGRHKVAETAVLTEQQRKAIRSLLT